jgi:hypothetical protein
VIRRLLAAWAILAVLAGTTAAEPPPDPLGLAPIVSMFNFDGTQTKVVWDDCGEVNAYYQNSTRTVTMCNELIGAMTPGAIRYVLAHELSHGVIMQLRVPYTGSHEAAADELAAVMLIATGRPEDVLRGAEFWASLGRDENPYDDHPGDNRRSFTLMCLVATSMELDPLRTCNADYDRSLSAWVKLLGMDQ